MRADTHHSKVGAREQVTGRTTNVVQPNSTPIDDLTLDTLRMGRFTPDERTLLLRAYKRARMWHQHQRRIRGEPYITHLVAVTHIVMDCGADATTAAASLLHDVAEDTTGTLDDVEQEFGAAVRFLVDGATEVGRGDGAAWIASREERFTATVRKVRSYAAQDGRLVIIKAADREHNLRTCTVMRPEARRRLALTTRQLHIPLCREYHQEEFATRLELLTDEVLKDGRHPETADPNSR